MLEILYVCMCTCVSNFKSFLSLEVYTMMLYVIRATNISAKITLFYEEKSENFNLIFYTFFFSRECIFPYLEIVCLIRKEIICRSYSPPRGRNPAAQPCTSNLKQKNKHFYSRSLSNFHYFRPKFGLISNSSFVFFLKKKFFECFCFECSVYTRKKFGEISKSQSLFSFRGERRFRDSTLERRFLPLRNKRVESTRSPLFGGKKRTHSAREK